MKIIDKNFFEQPAILLAPLLLGKYLCYKYNNIIIKSKITEVEAYCGIKDSACHTFNGLKTKRTEPMWNEGGTIYVYLCYGLHYMLNIVCGHNSPEAILIRSVKDANGPGRVSKYFNIDKSINNLSIIYSNLWLEDAELVKYKKAKRIGINYALPKDRNAMLRFISLE